MSIWLGGGRHGAAAENEPNAVKPRWAALEAGLLLGCSEMLRAGDFNAHKRDSKTGIRHRERGETC